MRVLSFLFLVGAAYGGPTTQPACLTLQTNDLCQFPFNYKGVIYDKCTYVETINNQPWCATVPEVNVTREGKVLFRSQVGDCDLESNCDVEDECQGKPCGELCGFGVCDGYGFCVNAIENPCEQHGCEGKSCGDDCLQGDIFGSCNIEGNCDFDSRKAIDSCNQQGLFDECKGKPCGELCGLGVCDGYGFCVNAEENPCEQHGCEGKSCGEECLQGDIVGSCDIDGNCDFDSGRAINSCDKQGRLDKCAGKPCGEGCQSGVCDGYGFCVNAEENPCEQHGCEGKSCGDQCLQGDIVGSCDAAGDCDFDSGRAINSCDKQGLFDECKGKPCGEGCQSVPYCDGCGGVCDGYGFCVNAEENPCEQHGCEGKSCGEECLQGDIVGSCDIEGDCNFDIGQAIDSCSKKVEDCSEDTLVDICKCPRLADPVCAGGESYGNLCIYRCAKKEAACQGQLDFPELEECN